MIGTNNISGQITKEVLIKIFSYNKYLKISLRLSLHVTFQCQHNVFWTLLSVHPIVLREATYYGLLLQTLWFNFLFLREWELVLEEGDGRRECEAANRAGVRMARILD